MLEWFCVCVLQNYYATLHTKSRTAPTHHHSSEKLQEMKDDCQSALVNSSYRSTPQQGRRNAEKFDHLMNYLVLGHFGLFVFYLNKIQDD